MNQAKTKRESSIQEEDAGSHDRKASQNHPAATAKDSFSGGGGGGASSSRLYDWRFLYWDLQEVLVLALRRSVGHRDRSPSTREEYRFWTSAQAHAVYACVMLAALTGLWRCFLALGALVVAVQIGWIVLKWAYYVRDDRQVDQFLDFCSTWIKRVLREGEKVLKGRDAVSYVMAFSAVRAAPTGFLYARYIVRYNLRRANAQILLEASERFGALVGDSTALGAAVAGSGVVSSTISRKADPVTGASAGTGSSNRAKQFTASLAFGPNRSVDYGVYEMPIEMDVNGIITDDDSAPRTLRAALAEKLRSKG
jgi:hypothetical protein